MRAAGIPFPGHRIARDLQGAVRAAAEIGYPVVLKVVSRDILHKSDVGGVALDLEDEAELVDAFQAVLHNCRTHQPEARIEGVEVSEMVAPGVEAIVGARRDPAFGPVLMFGLGGVYVEVLRDVAFRGLPLGRRGALEMVKDTKAYPLLLGVRGEARKDIEGVLDAILKLGTLVRRCPGITDVEINPLVVYRQGRGIKAVDVRVILEGAAGDRPPASNKRGEHT
jgi:acyl-CoA synthetase (NDP forming)